MPPSLTTIDSEPARARASRFSQPLGARRSSLIIALLVVTTGCAGYSQTRHDALVKMHERFSAHADHRARSAWEPAHALRSRCRDGAAEKRAIEREEANGRRSIAACSSRPAASVSAPTAGAETSTNPQREAVNEG